MHNHYAITKENKDSIMHLLYRAGTLAFLLFKNLACHDPKDNRKVSIKRWGPEPTNAGVLNDTICAIFFKGVPHLFLSNDDKKSLTA